MLKLSRQSSRTDHEFVVRLKPFVFKKSCEVSGVMVVKSIITSGGSGDPEICFDSQICSRGVNSKGLPDRRMNESWGYGGYTSRVLAHTMVLLLEPEQQAMFGDHFRSEAIRLDGSVDTLTEMGAAAERIDAAKAVIAAKFDADVEEARRLISENVVGG